MKIPAKVLIDFAEDVVRVAENGEIESKDLEDLQTKLARDMYLVDGAELATLEIGMLLVQSFYNTLKKTQEVH